MAVLLAFFLENFSQNHLGVGVGIAFYLRQALATGALTKDSRLTLLDLNPASFDTAQAPPKQTVGWEAKSCSTISCCRFLTKPLTRNL
jgi:hypothetical protein